MMKIFFLLLSLFFITTNSQSQAIKKYPIGNSGCLLYMFCNPGKFDLSYSDDSAKVYTGQCRNDNFIYGVICVELKESNDDMDDAENLLESYLDFLKRQFNIREAAGYGKGALLKEREDTRGIVDYWEGEDKTKWAIQGWTDGNFIAVLYVKGAAEPEFNKQQVFFKGFRFPGMQ